MYKYKCISNFQKDEKRNNSAAFCFKISFWYKFVRYKNIIEFKTRTELHFTENKNKQKQNAYIWKSLRFHIYIF